MRTTVSRGFLFRGEVARKVAFCLFVGHPKWCTPLPPLRLKTGKQGKQDKAQTGKEGQAKQGSNRRRKEPPSRGQGREEASPAPTRTKRTLPPTLHQRQPGTPGRCVVLDAADRRPPRRPCVSLARGKRRSPSVLLARGLSTSGAGAPAGCGGSTNAQPHQKWLPAH